LIPFRQDIRFARTADNLRIAYAVSGRGYPLVRGPTWMSNIELDWQTDVLGPVFRELSARYTLYRYNPRGYGLSEGQGTEASLDTFLADMEAVIDAAALQRFALWGQTAVGSMTELNEMFRVSTSPQHAARMVMAASQTDVSSLLGDVACPTLVLHCRASDRAPLQQARLIASSIPNARYVPLDSENYLPLADEPVFAQFIQAFEAFLPRPAAPSPNDGPLAELTQREREVLDLVARGLSNTDIASRLELSEKTVRNTVSHIFDKLAVGSRAQAIVLARRAGLGD
jgi:DNA-binding CsgD family transcriptional regulator/pimeloyl-ACP methyl ester carboxylesterase